MPKYICSDFRCRNKITGSEGAVLVVGAGGFIGRHITLAIAERTPQRRLIRLVRCSLLS